MESKFITFIGKSQDSKLLEVFLENRELQFNFSDIVQEARVRKDSVSPMLKKYVDMGIIKITYQKQSRKLYQLDKTNQVSKLLLKLFDTVIWHEEVRK